MMEPIEVDANHFAPVVGGRVEPLSAAAGRVARGPRTMMAMSRMRTPRRADAVGKFLVIGHLRCERILRR